MTLEGNRTRLALLAGALVLLGLGIWVLVVHGANRPADPELASVGAVSPTDPSPATPIGCSSTASARSRSPSTPATAPGCWRGACSPALDAQQRGRGLMEVTDLQGYSGMVFVYEEDVANGFYMRNTPTPLSIAWVAVDGGVVTITDMAPCEDRDGCPTYSPDGPYRYAIETFQGDLTDLGITEAATVSVGGRCAPTTTG